MKLAVLDPNATDHWSEVHAAGCADLKKRDRYGLPKGRDAWTLDADNLTDATWAIASDFIAERDDTEGEAEAVASFRDHYIHWAPCVVLPKEAEPEPMPVSALPDVNAVKAVLAAAQRLNLVHFASELIAPWERHGHPNFNLAAEAIVAEMNAQVAEVTQAMDLLDRLDKEDDDEARALLIDDIIGLADLNPTVHAMWKGYR